MRSLELSIPKPCHENWDSFTPTEKGGFCAACQKEVVDFTNWSDEAVLAYFNDRKKSASACGRFKTDQLKLYALPAPNTRRTWIPAAALGATLLLNPPDGHGQTVQTPSAHQVFIKNGEVEEKPALPDRVIRGQVFDNEDGSTIPGATVVLKGTKMGTTSDAEGRFELMIPESVAGDTLIASFIGYFPQKISTHDQQLLQFYLQEDVTLPQFTVSIDGLTRCAVTVTLGGIGVIERRPYAPRVIWRRFRNLFKFPG